MELSGWGITTSLPSGWEGRITRRADPAPPPGTAATPLGAVGEKMFPIAHLANFALPEERGDYGSGAVNVMTNDNAFMSLVEFGPDCANTALFAPTGLPRTVRASQFSRRALQRVLPGQAGYQAFFTEQDRAFCLFVVLAGVQNGAGLLGLVGQVNTVLAGVTIEPN